MLLQIIEAQCSGIYFFILSFKTICFYSFFQEFAFPHNINDNPKNNILMPENIRQKRLGILKYFDAYICHHYQLKVIQ